ncbi:glycosyltransferase family protein [Nitrogeniibacter aestuarii]|uniref:hypothetical protein n=1 Tax=Nitrogeniibacter aestuarii TaxID=2815343 RepID=UPI001D102495|nr:hypothetical protein [Nitrogeniibacter aestuarii]
MTAPRIFVGTLACGEAELEVCCSAIASQIGVQVTHRVISDQPEFEAHNLLWAAWGHAKADHDLFVKVDADTILNGDSALERIAALFADRRVTGAQMLLHDYFTDRLIAGLNAFSPRVEFRQASSRLFADHADRNHDLVLKGDATAHLAPIGWHCKFPHSRQAFHFGLHRALKKQREVISRCAEVWLQQRDEARAWALAGAMSAGWRMRNSHDYANDRFEKAFLRLKDDPARLVIEVEAFVRKKLGVEA